MKREHRIPSYLWRAYHRTVNRWRDVQALALGYCAARPSNGGYSHWRCALRRGHGEPHRFNNYTWTAGERVRYDPIDRAVNLPWKWLGTPTLRAVRERNRRADERAAQSGDRSAKWWRKLRQRDYREITWTETRDWIIGRDRA